MWKNVGRLFACTLAVVALTGCDWAQVGFDTTNSRANPIEPALTPTTVTHLAVAWSQPCRCGVPLVADGSVYALDDSVSGTTSVRAFDANTGVPRWSHPFAVSPPFTSVRLAAVAGGLVYLIVTRSVVALDVATGATRWSLTPPAPGTGTTTVDHLVVDRSSVHGTIAFVDVTSAIGNANPMSEISAVDATGTIVWSSSPGGQSAGFATMKANDQPDSDQRALVVISTLTAVQPPITILTQIDEDGGGYLRQVVVGQGGPGPFAFPGLGDVATANGLVYVEQNAGPGGITGSVFAVDPTDGHIVWSGAGDLPYAVNGNVLVSNLFTHGTVVGMQAFDARTGHMVWQGPGASDPAIAGSLLYVSNFTGAVVRDALTGTVVATFTIPNETLGRLVPSEGHVYTTGAQHLYALAPGG